MTQSGTCAFRVLNRSKNGNANYLLNHTARTNTLRESILFGDDRPEKAPGVMQMNPVDAVVLDCLILESDSEEAARRICRVHCDIDITFLWGVFR